jgi:ankyrin repeat protein
MSPIRQIQGTALHLAAYSGNIGRVRELLAEAGTDKNALDVVSLLCCCSSLGVCIFSYPYSRACKQNGATPLYWAAQRGHDDVVQFLIDEGAGINSRTKVSVLSDSTIPSICPTGLTVLLSKGLVQLLVSHLLLFMIPLQRS